jgi:hypothetical protein
VQRRRLFRRFRLPEARPRGRTRADPGDRSVRPILFILSLWLGVDLMSAPDILLAYLSPDTVLPVASIVATIAGGSMFVTRRSIRFFIRCFRRARRSLQRPSGTRELHFRSPEGELAP